MEPETLRALIASNVETAVELRRTADAVGKLAAQYENPQVAEVIRAAASIRQSSSILLGVAGVFALLFLVGFGSWRSETISNVQAIKEIKRAIDPYLLDNDSELADGQDHLDERMDRAGIPDFQEKD